MPGSGRPVLVVEDDPAIRLALQLMLEDLGYPVALAGNGREALDSIGHQRPSLVLLDMRMPVLDGWGFKSELGARGFDPPVVVMTTREDAGRIARELGAAGSLGKPFEYDELVTVVDQYRIP